MIALVAAAAWWATGREFLGFAIFAVGFAAGAWWRGRIDRVSPAVMREIREQSDRIAVVVLSDQAQRRAGEEQARRALLYPTEIQLPRDTSVD